MVSVTERGNMYGLNKKIRTGVSFFKVKNKILENYVKIKVLLDTFMYSQSDTVVIYSLQKYTHLFIVSIPISSKIKPLATQISSYSLGSLKFFYPCNHFANVFVFNRNQLVSKRNEKSVFFLRITASGWVFLPSAP